MADMITVEDLPEQMRAQYAAQARRITSIRRFKDGHAGEFAVHVIKIAFADGQTVHKWKSVNGSVWVPFGGWARREVTRGSIDTPAPAQSVEQRAAAVAARTRRWQ